MGPVDVEKLDEEIRKLQELRRLASDPSLARFFVNSNGHKSTSGITEASMNAVVNAAASTGVSATVLAVCRSLSGEFTIREVFAGMNARGYAFKGNAKKAVANALRKLSTGSNPKIKIVRASSGRRPIAYVNP